MFPDKQLDIVVAPDKVRLQPQPEDRYAWSVKPEKSYLLKKSLGNNTVGFYQTICKEIGHSLKAVLPQTLQGSQTDPDDLS